MTVQPMGEFIASLRKDAGYTQQDVAEKLNISDRTLSSWETGRTEPDLSSLTALAELYGVTADEILHGRRNSAPCNNADTADANPLKERFADFLNAIKKLTATGALCAAVAVVGFILLLFVPAPMWVDFTLVFAGAAGNAVCAASVFGNANKALLNVPENDRGVALTVKHKALLCVIINSLAYIAGVIVILLCYWFVSYYDANPVGTVNENYDLYAAASVIICFVLGGAQFIFAVAANLANINGFGSERQKSAVKANVKLFRIISVCGAAFVALCLIPYAVFCHVNFTETEQTYFTVKGVDKVYETFQTYSLGSDKILTDVDSDGNVRITVIRAGDYYLDFQTERYIDVKKINDYEPVGVIPLYDLGNRFYANFHGYKTNNLTDLSDGISVGLYYLKDGVNIEDISLEKDYKEYFQYLTSYPVVKFTSPENEPLFSVRLKYFWQRDKGYYDEEGWRYDYDVYYNIRDELVLSLNGDVYSYNLVTSRNYTPLATLVLLGSVCATACVCAAIQLIRRKKITYSF